MKVLAILNPEESVSLAQFLGTQLIPFQQQAETDETGLELTGFLVTDDDYEKACDAIEQWQALGSEKLERKINLRCPSCHSPHIETTSVDEKESLTKIAVIYTCKDCGRVFTSRI